MPRPLVPCLFAFLGLSAFLILGLALFLAGDWWFCRPADETAYYVGRGQCERCHQEETELWAESDHDLAMDRATPDAVLGDFDDARHTHPLTGITSKMFRRGDEFLVTTDDSNGRMREFKVEYVFGVRPLQQYLVHTHGGRLQCLPVAWDTENKRWFHLYPHEKIPAGDELHWTGPLQNWNYMCAECHSTDLQKKFDLATNTYHTTFSEIDVSCETCHGPGSLHVELADAKGPFWDRRHGFGLPNLKSEDPHVEIETCAPCHSRRRIVYPGFRPGNKFLDYYMPQLLDNDLYYADGQILEEDYVYGSFIQSRMYREKVRCTNCHDPHTTRVKFKDNRLCGQCHVPATYDTPKHHHHPDSSQPGTLCVECHMPNTTYMVVDPRRDHSLRIPRPDLTVSLKIPNACTGCHDDKSKGETPEWAEQQVETWYGKRKGPKHFAYAIAAGRRGEPAGLTELLAVVKRKDLSAMVRASATSLLGRYPGESARFACFRGLEDSDPLVRAAAVRSLENVSPTDLLRRLAPLLRDPIRAVRTEAARLLSAVPQREFSADDRKAFDAALAEYLVGQEASGDQAAAHLNSAVVHTNRRRLAEAEAEYRTALRLDPTFVPARINLAMLSEQQGNRAEAERQFRKVIELSPELAEAHYSLGLLLAEDHKRLDEAAEFLAAAARLSPNNPRMHYNHGLALQRLGRPDEAEEALRAAHKLSPRMPDYLNALAILYSQQKRWARAVACAEELTRLDPHNPQYRSLLEHLKREAAGSKP